MKKALAILLAALFCLAFAACGKEPEQPAQGDETTTSQAETTTAAEETAAAAEETTEAADETSAAEESAASEAQSGLPRLIINSEPVVVTAKDGFDNAGVTAFLCDATETYSFKASSADVKWTIFVLDEEFTDGARYLAQAETPMLEGDGTLTIEAGKLIYILCSESAFNADAASDATLTINYAA